MEWAPTRRPLVLKLAGSAEDVATKARTQRRTQLGDKGASDKSEKLPVGEREKQLEAELVAEGARSRRPNRSPSSTCARTSNSSSRRPTFPAQPCSTSA